VAPKRAATPPPIATGGFFGSPRAQQPQSSASRGVCYQYQNNRYCDRPDCGFDHLSRDGSVLMSYPKTASEIPGARTGSRERAALGIPLAAPASPSSSSTRSGTSFGMATQPAVQPTSILQRPSAPSLSASVSSTGTTGAASMNRMGDMHRIRADGSGCTPMDDGCCYVKADSDGDAMLIEAPIVFDSGADRNFISKGLIQALIAAGSSVVVNDDSSLTFADFTGGLRTASLAHPSHKNCCGSGEPS
jgi:hypothetical protein